MSVAVCAVSAGNYLPMARVMAESFRSLHPDVPLLLGLSDSPEGRIRPGGEPFEVVPLDALRLPGAPALPFRYSRRELAIAIKPYMLEHALDRGYDVAVYIDVDVLVLGDLSGLLRAAGESSITLVPHLLEPPQGTDRVSRELTILQSGVFNGGVLGVRESREAREMLAWWQARLAAYCEHSVAEGHHYDQRWLDLLSSYFGVGVYADPRVNVAHWNLRERDLASCRLFHFSGYDPNRPQVLTRYASRPSFADAPEVIPLFRRFQTAVLAAGWREEQQRPYAYGGFDNGIPISDEVRTAYRALGPAAAEFGDPFRAAGAETFFHWFAGAQEGRERRYG